MRDLVVILPHVNATLNAVATVLLVIGILLIKRRREVAHKRTMLACFAVSVLFLASYLTYHGSLRTLGVPERRLPTSLGQVYRVGYFAMLISHVVLAATVPVLASMTIWYGLKDKRTSHVRLARWTFPIWLYVSVTGVLIYFILYQFLPS